MDNYTINLVIIDSYKIEVETNYSSNKKIEITSANYELQLTNNNISIKTSSITKKI